MHRAIQQKEYSLIKIQIKWLISSQYNNAKISNVFSEHKNSLAQKKKKKDVQLYFHVGYLCILKFF